MIPELSPDELSALRKIAETDKNFGVGVPTGFGHEHRRLLELGFTSERLDDRIYFGISIRFSVITDAGRAYLAFIDQPSKDRHNA